MPVKNAAEALSIVPQAAPAQSLQEPRPASAKGLAKLWLIGIGAWGHRWVSSLGELPVNDDGSLTACGALWSRKLAGLTERQVLEAVDYFAGCRDWPPTVGEIRKRVLGVPEFEFVRASITERRCGFTRMVSQHLDHWAFTRADQREADRLLRVAYDLAAERRMRGEEFPAHLAGELTHVATPFVLAKPETVARAREEVRALLAGNA